MNKAKSILPTLIAVSMAGTAGAAHCIVLR
jgi:hypothetical protein